MTEPALPSPCQTITLYEFGDFHALPADADLEGLKTYLKRVWAGRTSFYDADPAGGNPDEAATTVNRHGQALLQFDGREVRARNYCGFIRYGNLTLRIVPKLFAGGAWSWESVFRHLHYYLSYARPSHFPFDWSETAPGGGEDPLQWLIGIFARFARFTLSDRPLHTYAGITEATGFLRGRLEVGAYLREQISTGQWQHLHSEYSLYQLDNPFNQVVCCVAARLLPLAAPESRDDLRDVLHGLEGVSSRACTGYDCDKAAGSHLPAPHARLLDMCRWFLAGVHGADATGQFPAFSFLVPAERVFEDFIAGFARRHFPGRRVETQGTAYLGRAAGKPAGLIRNDLWLPGGRVVADVKYKRIEPLIAAVPPGDLYQALAYAIARGVAHAHLLYPAPQYPAPENLQLEIPVPAADATVTIHVHFVSVTAPSAEIGATNPSFVQLTQHLQEKLQKIITFSPA